MPLPQSPHSNFDESNDSLNTNAIESDLSPSASHVGAGGISAFNSPTNSTQHSQQADYNDFEDDDEESLPDLTSMGWNIPSNHQEEAEDEESEENDEEWDDEEWDDDDDEEDEQHTNHNAKWDDDDEGEWDEDEEGYEDEDSEHENNDDEDYDDEGSENDDEDGHHTSGIADYEFEDEDDEDENEEDDEDGDWSWDDEDDEPQPHGATPAHINEPYDDYDDDDVEEENDDDDPAFTIEDDDEIDYGNNHEDSISNTPISDENDSDNAPDPWLMLEGNSDDDSTEDTEDSPTPNTSQSNAGGFKEKFAEFKRKARAELRGETAPTSPANSSSDEPTNTSADDENEDEESLDDEDGGATPAGGSQGNGFKAAISKILSLAPLRFLGRILSPVKKLYLSLTNLIFTVIEKILGLFAKLPLIGKPFSWALGFTHILRKIATCIPLVLLILFVVHMNRSAVPHDAKIDLPDGGGVTVTNMSYDDKTHMAYGTFTNTGQIIADVKPTFKVHSTSLIHPLSWAFPRDLGSCPGQIMHLEIGQTRKIEAKCNFNVSGILIKTSAKLEAE